MKFALAFIVAFLLQVPTYAQTWSCMDAKSHIYRSTQDVPSDTCVKVDSKAMATATTQAETVANSPAKANDASAGFAILAVLFIAGMLLYFAPTIRAKSVDHPDTTAIFVLNLLLGWLLIPWVIALVWSYKGNHKAQNAAPVRISRWATPAPESAVPEMPLPRLCPFCAEEIKPTAIRCKHCQADLATASI